MLQNTGCRWDAELIALVFAYSGVSAAQLLACGLHILLRSATVAAACAYNLMLNLERPCAQRMASMGYIVCSSSFVTR
jgi:hypothetical protein